MAQVTITINAREYGIACEDGQEMRIIQLARLLDEKAKMITNGVSQVSESMLLAMIGLLLADELSELKKPSLSQAGNEEPVDNNRLLAFDKDIAEKIKKITSEIKSIASNLNMM